MQNFRRVQEIRWLEHHCCRLASRVSGKVCEAAALEPPRPVHGVLGCLATITSLDRLGNGHALAWHVPLAMSPAPCIMQLIESGRISEPCGPLALHATQAWDGSCRRAGTGEQSRIVRVPDDGIQHAWCWPPHCPRHRGPQQAPSAAPESARPRPPRLSPCPHRHHTVPHAPSAIRPITRSAHLTHPRAMHGFCSPTRASLNRAWLTAASSGAPCCKLSEPLTAVKSADSYPAPPVTPCRVFGHALLCIWPSSHRSRSAATGQMGTASCRSATRC